MKNMGTRALENIKALGSLEKFGARAGQGRTATGNIKKELESRAKKKTK